LIATKACSLCRVEKLVASFSADRTKPDGLRTYCRACASERAKAGRRPWALPLGEQARAVAAAPGAPPLEAVEEHRLKRRVAEQEARIRALVSDLSDARAMRDLGAEARGAAAPPIVPRERASGLREGTALVLASDWHIEEEVRPEQVSGRNRYNLEISRARMTRFFEATRWGINFNRQAFRIRDVVLWLGGDLITNYLHPDNVETNLLSPVQAIALAKQAIGDGIRFLLEDGEIENLTIPCNDGNHGRLTEKMRSASRAANSIEWLLYTMLAQDFAHDKRVRFQIADGEHTYLNVYGRSVRFTHGDSVRYHGGVGGITIPLYKALARWDTVRRADLTCVGHFHQLTSLSDLIVNGSLIGFGPYSQTIGARYEAPAQAMTILDPQRFKSIALPLWVSDRDDDEAAP
jgi:hypothetical protein